jgi:hypothetical protein
MSNADPPYDQEADDTANWPEPAPDPAEEHGETTEGVLPTLERIRTMSKEELTELRDLVLTWEGALVERFRQRVAERLAS